MIVLTDLKVLACRAIIGLQGGCHSEPRRGEEPPSDRESLSVIKLQQASCSFISTDSLVFDIIFDKL